MHRRVSLVIDVVDLRQTAVDVSLDDVQQSITRRLRTTANRLSNYQELSLRRLMTF